MEATNAFLGTGWGFPPSFSKPECTVRMVSNEDDICESLHILLRTSLGERAIEPGYGCNLEDAMFESLSTTFVTYLQELIKTAILRYEPRIDLKNAFFRTTEQEGLLHITLDYVVRSTNSRFNIVFPFYIKEGTNIDL